MGAPDWVDVCPIENGDFPASHLSLLEGRYNRFIPMQQDSMRSIDLPNSPRWNGWNGHMDGLEEEVK